MTEIVLRAKHKRLTDEVKQIECDLHSEISPHQMFAVAQVTAHHHIQVSPSLESHRLYEQGIAWMISAVSMLFDPPRVFSGENMISETWAPGIRGVRFKRHHAFYRETPTLQQLFALGASDWFLVDKETRKPIRPAEIIPDEEVAIWASSWPPAEFSAQRIAPILETETLSRLEQGDDTISLFYRDFYVAYSFIDDNRHLNNIHYAAFSVDTLVDYLAREEPLQFEQYVLREVHVNYVAEVFLAEAVRIFLREVEDAMPSEHVIDYDGVSKTFAPLKDTRGFLLEGWNLQKKETAFRAKIVLELR